MPGRRSSALSRSFTETTFHLITGLLLPIWNRSAARPTLRPVGRLQTDEGERIIGRLVSPEALAKVRDPWAAVLVRAATTLHLAAVLARRSLVRAHSAWSSPASAIKASTS